MRRVLRAFVGICFLLTCLVCFLVVGCDIGREPVKIVIPEVAGHEIVDIVYHADEYNSDTGQITRKITYYIATPTATAALTPTPIPTPTATPEVTCYVGDFVLQDPDLGGIFVIGEGALCGMDLHFADVYVGPDYETALALCHNKTDRWRDCAREKICSEEMEVWWEEK